MSNHTDFKVKNGLVVNTTATILGTTSATSTTSGALQVVGGAGIQGDLYARNIYSNGVLVGSGAGSATTATNLAGGYTGAVPFQSATSSTTFAPGFLFSNGFLQTNSATVLTTATVIGQAGVAITASNTSLYISLTSSVTTGLPVDFGLIGDPLNAITYDFGSF